MESFRRFFLPHYGSFLRFFEIIALFSQKGEEKFADIKKMRTFAPVLKRTTLTVGSYNG